MVKNKPVSLTRQTIYCLIPVMDIYAAYRVKSLRKYLVLMLAVMGIPLSIIESIMFPRKEVSLESFLQFWTFYYGVDDAHFAFSMIAWIVTVLFAIFLIRRWSKQWNEKFIPK